VAPAIVARTLVARLTQPSQITGADLNPSMIEVAKQQQMTSIHSFGWIIAPAQEIPFEDATFDLAFCQQGLQFFSDKSAALSEFRRILRPGGRVVLTCWAAVPTFFEMIGDVMQRHLDAQSGATVIQPFIWSDSELIQKLLKNAGFDCPPASPLPVTRHMAATHETIREEILATPDEPTLRAAGDEAVNAIAAEILVNAVQFRQGDQLVVPQLAHLFDATAV
jgi:SAM-dependent methyltransferase